jgi:putative ABC transport system permease protein
MFSRLRSLWKALWNRSQTDSELHDELRFHIESRAQDLLRSGLSTEEAHRRARVEFGSMVSYQEQVRETRRVTWLEDFVQDWRYGWRGLRKNPGFAAVAIFTLALGIGANTAIFSVVYAVVLKPLPYANSEQLFNVFEVKPQEGITGTGWSYLNFAELRERNTVFSEMAGVQRHQLAMTVRGEPSVVQTSIVTPELFSLFGGAPLAGRIFFSQDGKAGAPPLVILSEDLWRSSFAADPNIIGSSINLDKRPFTIIGIMPSAFRFPSLAQSEQVWIPLVQDPLFSGWMDRRGGHWLQVTGRLKPGVSRALAQAEMDAMSASLAKAFPAENDGWAIRMVPLQQLIVGSARTPLFVLLGAVGLVLLIACANIANLLLTRATSRAREIAVRTMLGAGRARIVRQLLSETAMLGLLGGLSGIALAYWGVQVLTSLLPPNLPQVNAIRVDQVVLGFALLLSFIASLAFGLAPALFAANSKLQTGLREGGGRTGEAGNRRRARSFLAAGEIALAMVLLVAAGLLLRSFSNLMSVSPGFDPRHIVMADVSLPRFQYSTPQQWTAFSDELLTRIQSQPGLQDSALAVPRPIADGFVNLGFDMVGNPPLTAGTSRTANYVSVSPDYFRVMGVPLLAGRSFSRHDVVSAPRVCLISQTMARIYFPNQDPLGKRLTFGFPPDGAPEREIVGIVGDVRDVALGKDPGPMMYVPYAQAPFWGANLVVKSTLALSSVAAAIRQEVRKIDKDLPVTDVSMLPDRIEASVAQPRFGTLLLSLFAAMALVLAATGIFGRALGAQTGDVLNQVLWEGGQLAAVGLALGLGGSLAATRLMATLLFGVKPADPLTFGSVASLLACVTLAATYFPARRATRVDPIVALRHE